ncbi:unnamed protein product [Adineta steineri]|uniref:Uncharacterized protein n=3 Tax=Adineta steineri TaxID=433720 RepID=A0A818YBC9_9BILA|nr:unnamed protein product [Adineta steineri]CAF3750399.1 unnamed protein product [Adineta steineri]
MIFYLTLFNLIFILNKTCGMLNIEFDVKNECSVRLETDHGIETCLNQQCSDFKDPWRVINSHIQDEPCYLHYLKLSFTTYDQLLVFIELQQSSNNRLENFFSNDETKHCMLEIQINKIYPFNENYFLSEDMLNKLGGPIGKIDILQIEILNWYNSTRSVIQIIDNNIVDKQPFQQITIFYPCNFHHTMERLVLAKYLAYQERSSCPSQINVINGDELLISNDETIYIQKYKPINTFQYDDFNKSYNKSDDTDDNKNKSHQSNLFAKIFIIFIIIIGICLLFAYHYYCSSSQSSN